MYCVVSAGGVYLNLLLFKGLIVTRIHGVAILPPSD